jgi:hypothetical protein
MATCCYPPNFLEALLAASKYLDEAATNEAVSKQDVCDGMEMRLSLLIGKAVAAPLGGSFSIFHREEEEPQQTQPQKMAAAHETDSPYLTP